MTDVHLESRLQERLLAEPASTGDTDALRGHLARLLIEEAPLLPAAQADAVLDAVLRDVVGFGPLEALLADPTVNEIMLNGPGIAYVERAGVLEAVDLGLDASGVEQLAQRVVAPLGLRLDRAAPIADARLADGSRLHAILPPLAPDGPIVTIRRFATRRLGLDDFGATAEAAGFLASAVAEGRNILVAGATSAGKTTALNALGATIGSNERIVTIEETAELQLPCVHVVRLEARPANGEGAGAVSVRDLVRASLRMRPDRIIVGEVRGTEALDMLQALNTGHDGSLCTVHANSPHDALVRLETLALFAASGLPVEAIRRQIVGAIDLVVFVARHGARRRITAIVEVDSAGPDGCAVHALFGFDDAAQLRLIGAARRVPRRAAPSKPVTP